VDSRDKFATYFRDGVGQDYADQRYYGSGTGRFMTVDPGGIKTANSSDPGSWNRYAYVQGDSVNHTDRHGLYLDAEQCADDPDACLSEDGGCDGYASGFNLLGDPTPPDPDCPVGWDPPPPPPAPAPGMYLLETSACVDPRGNSVTPYYALEVTYQLYIDGSAVYSNTEMSSFGIQYISEKLTNATGNMAQKTPGRWCQGYIPPGACIPADIGTLNGNGTFIDILGGQGTLTQSFYIDGTGAPLNVVFTSFVGPQQPLTALNNTYNSTPGRGKKPSISIAGGLLTSSGQGDCNK
jgi:RHS repeat-associated protein